MNINENIRIKRKFIDKLKGVPTKLPISYLLTILEYQSRYYFNAKVLYQCLDIVLLPYGRIEKISNLNIHEF